MELILLTPPESHPDEIVLLHRFFEAGLPTLHVHKPDWNVGQLRDYFGQIDAKWHNRIVLHAYPHNLDAASPLNELNFALKGIHQPERVRQEAMPLPAKFKVVSTSFHYIKDLLTCEGEYEYLFISPIFNSISKAGYQAAFDLDDLKNALAKSQHQVIALGGIDKDKIEQVRELGFAGIGVLGGVWKADKPVECLGELLALLARHPA